MRRIAKHVSSVVHLIGILLAAIAVSAVVCGPPILMIYVIVHFVLKFW